MAPIAQTRHMQHLSVVMRKAACCSKLYMQISAEVAVAVSKLVKDVWLKLTALSSTGVWDAPDCICTRISNSETSVIMLSTAWSFKTAVYNAADEIAGGNMESNMDVWSHMVLAPMLLTSM